ncbi:MAG TPA: hypothetical protein VE967_18355, partial [Gemmatimonadaceae bacterium]|nr:hypothetical protein [Gemmatimonadaceae bacterium]
VHQLLPEVLAQGRGLADTVVSVSAGAHGLRLVLDIAELGAFVLVYALLGGVIFAALKARAAFEKAHTSLDDIAKDIRNLAENANKIAENVTQVAESIKSDVKSVHSTVDYASARARRAIGLIADRVEEFSDAVETVQSSAQHGLVNAIAAVRGLKAGVGAFRKRPRRVARELEGKPAPVAPDIPARPRLRRKAQGHR